MSRKRGVALFVLLLVALSVAVVPGTAAAENRYGGTVVVEEGETVNDLEAYGGSVLVRGTVNGDLEGAAGSVVITGTVTGNVEVTAGNVQIAGTVRGDVEVAAGSLVVERTGVVNGSLAAGAGHVRIDGVVEGTVRSGADTTVLGPSARIGGDLRYANDLQRADGATVAGQVVHDESISVDVGFGPSISIPGWTFLVYGLAVNFVVGAIGLLLVPNVGRSAADRFADAPLRSAGAGLAALIGIPILLAVTMITIVGIPLALAGVFCYVLLLWIGYVTGAFALGSWLLSLADVSSRFGALALGLLVVAAASLVPVAGGLVEFAVFLLGLGAISLTLVALVRDARGGEASAEAA